MVAMAQMMSHPITPSVLEAGLWADGEKVTADLEIPERGGWKWWQEDCPFPLSFSAGTQPVCGHRRLPE